MVKLILFLKAIGIISLSATSIGLAWLDMHTVMNYAPEIIFGLTALSKIVSVGTSMLVAYWGFRSKKKKGGEN